MEILPDKPFLNVVDYQVADSPEWSPFFEGFPEPLTRDEKALMARNFLDFMSKEIGRMFERALRRMKEAKRRI